MPFLAQIENIDTAIANLNLKKGTLKAQFIAEIRSNFTDPESLGTITAIPTEDLIRKIWGTDDPKEIKNKRKNFSGLKSSINKTLKQLIKEEKNPDGIIISRDNIFTIAEEQKDQIIQQLGLTTDSIRSFQEMLKSFKTFISDTGQGNSADDLKNLLDKLNKTQEMLDSVAGEDSTENLEEVEEVEEFDEDEFIEVDEDQLAALQGQGEEVGDAGEISEEVEELDEDDFIEVDEEQLTALQGQGEEAGDAEDISEEVEEVEELDEDDFIEVDEEQLATLQGQGEEVGDAEEISEEVEELDEDDFIEVDEEQLADLQVQGEEVGDAGEISEEVEELDEDDFIEVDEDQLAALQGQSEEEEPEIILDESDYEETEIIDEEELTEIEEIEDHPGKSPAMLEALSKYIDPEEALTSGNAEYLTESHDEYVAQLLARFMPRFIKIPTGQYHIGCSHPRPNERPEQSITLKSFYIGQFPVTNDLFEIFVRETGYETSAEKHGYGNVIEGRYVSRTDTDSGRATLIVSNGTMEHRVAGANWRNPKGPGSNNKGKYNHPVVQISYADALAFAVWAGKRLPSEDEWEAAARGQDNRLFPWGNTWLLKLGNFESSALGDSTPVDHHGRESASPYGLYDMLGNVYEWTASLHHPANQHPESRNQIHILKGGCWASRKAIHIGHRMIEKGDRWSNIIGFRCAV